MRRTSYTADEGDPHKTFNKFQKAGRLNKSGTTAYNKGTPNPSQSYLCTDLFMQRHLRDHSAVEKTGNKAVGSRRHTKWRTVTPFTTPSLP